MTFGMREITKGLSEKVSVRRSKKWVAQAKDTAIAKALRWEQTWCA